MVKIIGQKVSFSYLYASSSGKLWNFFSDIKMYGDWYFRISLLRDTQIFPCQIRTPFGKIIELAEF